MRAYLAAGALLAVSFASMATTAAEADVAVSGSLSRVYSHGDPYGYTAPVSTSSSYIGLEGFDGRVLRAQDDTEKKSLSDFGYIPVTSAAGRNGNPGIFNQDLRLNTSSTLFDTLSLNGKSTDDGKAVLHMKVALKVIQNQDFVHGSATDSLPPKFFYDNFGEYSTKISSTNAILSGGRLDSNYKFVINDGKFQSLNNDGTSGPNSFEETLDFSLGLSFKDATSFSISLDSLITESLDEHFPALYQWTDMVFGETDLSFLDGISITDEHNNDLCGLTVTKASGEIWGQTNACQGNGGDGGNGGGGTGSVPEPASWALMLGGFGLIGGAMRASRRKVVVAIQ